MNPLILKYLALAGVATGLLLAGFYSGKRWESAVWLEKEVTRLEALREQDKLDAEARLQQSEDYNAKLRKLEDEYRNRPARVVRVCDKPASVSGTAGGTDGAPAGGLPATVGPDIGQDLYDLAQDADKCAIQLKELQAWAKRVASKQD